MNSEATHQMIYSDLADRVPDPDGTLDVAGLENFRTLELKYHPTRWYRKITERLEIGDGEISRSIEQVIELPHLRSIGAAGSQVAGDIREFAGSTPVVILTPRKDALVAVEMTGESILCRRYSHADHITLARDCISMRMWTLWGTVSEKSAPLFNRFLRLEKLLKKIPDASPRRASEIIDRAFTRRRGV